MRSLTLLWFLCVLRLEVEEGECLVSGGDERATPPPPSMIVRPGMHITVPFLLLQHISPSYFNLSRLNV